MLQQVLAFLTTPAHLAVEWMILTAIVSSVYHKAEANPRLHAVLSSMVSAGIDLPKLWEALGRVVTGELPVPSTAAIKAAAVKSLMLLAVVACLGCSGNTAAMLANEGNVAAYGSEQIECVTLAATRDQADACRAAVRENWCGPGRPLQEAGACSVSAASVTVVTIVDGGAK